MYCSHCGAQNPEDSKECIECGRTIGHKKKETASADEPVPVLSEQEPRAEPAASHAAGHIFCPYCGMKNSGGDSNCAACGRPLRALTGQDNARTGAGGQYGAAQPGRQPPPGGYGQYQQYAPPGAPPQSTLVQLKDYFIHNLIITIVSFICCCQPISFILGIIGMVISNSAKNKLSFGDINGAEDSANTAKILFYISLAFILISIIGSILYLFFVIGFSSFAGTFEGAMNNMGHMNQQLNSF